MINLIKNINYRDLIGHYYYISDYIPYAIIDNVIKMPNNYYRIYLKDIKNTKYLNYVDLTYEELLSLYNKLLIRKERSEILKERNIEKIVQKLRSINLIHVGSNTGHIFLSNNGLDFLHAYGALRKEEWPAKISNFDTNMVLQNLALCGILVIKHDELTIRSVMWHIFVKIIAIKEDARSAKSTKCGNVFLMNLSPLLKRQHRDRLNIGDSRRWWTPLSIFLMVRILFP